MEILILFGLILLNGVFAMSEIAIVTARKARLAKMASEGSRSAAIALKLGEDPTHFLSAVQIGITSIGLLNGIYGESLLAQPFALWLQEWGLSPKSSSLLATVIVVVLVTYLSIVVGELVPKRLGQLSAERIACLVARPMLWLATLTRPFVWLLSASTNASLRLLRVDQRSNNNVTQEEIHAMLVEGSEAGVIEDHEHTMLRNVFRLDERSLASLMVPRSDIRYLDLSLPLEVNLQRLVEYRHSFFPVCDGSLSDLVGILNVSKVLHAYIKGEPIDLAALTQDGSLLPETLNGLELLNHFRTHSEHMVLVVDEYGELQGLVTQQDLLETLAGDFQQEDGEDNWAFQRADGSWLLDGLIPLPELKDCLELVRLPEEEKHHYHTLGGLIMLLLGRLPQTGDLVTLEQWQLEIVDMDGLRIDKVLAMPLTDQPS
ncbi:MULTISPECIES: hemolysin family protein [Aeromonas]|uniref:hemolysin family protein n=1 Tax=Aeromonas TaxID=642 RepID=UPI001C23F6E1|nr:MULTISPECIES: hemolysin family protein [Aeromonas]MCR3939197.1 hemolysin family protein [Aeromonas caviae]MCR3946791.1 hemolysin family protein [Aeromonas caviae]MEB5774759.1 hemolysin family protein [Aeromonas caviae]MEB6650066.1 hemolysin family protein [Aeromonas caviae]QWZ55082.1 hemolysin family protein [Aeromonas sp. FDAARGOS 1402]